MSQLVISVLGKDSPGLVEQLSNIVCQHHGNWVSCSMTQLAGQFAGIVQVTVDSANQAALVTSLEQLSSLQIHVVNGEHATHPTRQQSLTVTGNDRQGIVNQVASLLHQRGINICKLKTEVQSAPNWGYPLFIARFQVEMNHQMDFDSIQAQLEQLADDLTIDLE